GVALLVWNAREFKAELLAEAAQQGFPLAGVAPATPAETRAAYEEWIAAGHAGEMAYLGRDPARRADPTLVWPDTASILVVGMPYRDWEPEPAARHDPLRGQFAR